MDWEHVVGMSAGAGLAGSRLLASDVSFAQCQKACRIDAACSAFDYVRKHSDEATATALRNSPQVCPKMKKPRKRSCFAVEGAAWHPCKQPETENIIARKRPPLAVPSGAKSVLMVIFDDLRVVDEPYRQRAVPTAMSFAAESTTFLSAHAQCALCAPSRASFLSGRRPDVTRVLWTDNFLREWPPAQGWISLPQHFKRSGYYVAAAGKLYHHLPDPMSLDPMSWTEPECIVDYPYYGQGHCPEKPEYLSQVHNTSAACPVETSRHPSYVFTDRLVLAKAQQFLASAAPLARTGSQPFWIGVGFFKPHKPFIFPAELLQRMPALDEIQLAENGDTPRSMVPMSNIPELCATKAAYGPYISTCARDTIRTYHAAAAFTDSLLGDLLASVDRLQLQKDTLVVVLSDHGFALGEHASWAKWTNWEVATRTVLMIRAPWLPQSAGQRVSSIVELVDLYPTIAELAGVAVSVQSPGYEELGGRSVAPLLRGASGGEDSAAFSQIARCWPSGGPHNASAFAAMGQCDKVPSSEYAFMGYSIRTAMYRYTEWVPIQWDPATHQHLPRWEDSIGDELYIHEGDDGGAGWTRQWENENVASARPAEVARLRRRLHARFEAFQDAARRTAST